MSKLRVCHITSSHGKEDVRIFLKECVSLSKKYDTTLVQLGDSYEKDGVKIVGFGKRPDSRLYRLLFAGRKAFKAALKVDADVYHAHDPELLKYCLKLKKKGKTVIFDSHENYCDAVLNKRYIPSFMKKSVRNWFYRFQKKVCSAIDGVVVVTPDLLDFFKEINKNVVMVTNYPFYVELEGKPNYESKQLGFVGALDDDWSHSRIISALTKIPSSKYLLAGVGDQDYIDSLKKVNGWNQVTFLGKIPHSTVFDRLKECAVGMALLVPSFNTFWDRGTMGNTKIFEEMSVGLPIICTNFILWKEFVDKYKCGIYVDPYNEDEIYNAINSLLNNPKLCEELGNNAKLAVKNEFNWGHEEAKLYDFYDTILKEKEGTINQ